MNDRQLQQQVKAQQQAARSIRLQNEKRKREVRNVISNMMNKQTAMYD
jgi:hypothetical protein